MSDCGYIYVRNWDRFQHYKNRRPAWIKLYLDLFNDDEYLSLTPSDRCLLQACWMVAAESGNGRARADQSTLRVRSKSPKGSLKRLSDAGFITIRASKALAEVLAPEVEQEQEIEPPKSPVERGTIGRVNGSTKKDATETDEQAAERHRIVRELLPFPMRERWVSDAVLDTFHPSDCKTLSWAWGRSNDLRDNGQRIEEANDPRAYALKIAGHHTDA